MIVLGISHGKIMINHGSWGLNPIYIFPDKPISKVGAQSRHLALESQSSESQRPIDWSFMVIRLKFGSDERFGSGFGPSASSWESVSYSLFISSCINWLLISSNSKSYDKLVAASQAKGSVSIPEKLGNPMVTWQPAR